MITLYDSSDPGLYTFRFYFPGKFREAVALLKKFPGCRYAGDEYGKGVWVAPFESRDFLQWCVKKLGGELVDKTEPEQAPRFVLPEDSRGYPYQTEAANAAISDWGKLYLFDPGLGKSATAIFTLMRAFVGGNTLIACPAVVRQTWVNEIAKWDTREPEVTMLTTGKQIIALDEEGIPNPGPVPRYYITSYNLLKQVANLPIEQKFSALIADEVHLVKKETAGCTKAWLAVREQNLEALAIGLSGTPADNRLHDLVGEVSALWPKRFGTWWGFTERYYFCQPGKYGGKTVGDLKEYRTDELQERINAVSVRVTKDDVADLLPPLRVQRIEVPYKREKFHRSLKAAKKDFSGYLKRHATKRVKEAFEWITSRGESHVAAITYRVDTARELHNTFVEAGYNSVLITGEDVSNTEKRHELITQSLSTEQCFLVASMKSIGIGIDALSGYSTALFLELYYKPGVVIQAMERFHRLSSKSAVLIAFLIMKGTLDEVLVSQLQPKVTEFLKIMRTGTTAAKLNEALQPSESDEDFFARMRTIVEDFEEDDEY